jgi:hypothetical protein
VKIDGMRTRRPAAWLDAAPHQGRTTTDHGGGAVRTGEATSGDPCPAPLPALTGQGDSRPDLSLTAPGRVRRG